MQSSEDSSQPPSAHVMIESLSLFRPIDLDDVEDNVIHYDDTRNFKKFRKVIATFDAFFIKDCCTDIKALSFLNRV